jgi:hypothetical protein
MAGVHLSANMSTSRATSHRQLSVPSKLAYSSGEFATPDEEQDVWYTRIESIIRVALIYASIMYSADDAIRPYTLVSARCSSFSAAL